MPFRRIDLFAVPLAVLVAVLCGCGGASGGSGNAAATQLPQGVTGSAVTGVYPAGPDEECCWTGPDVRFAVPADGAARTLQLDVYEPQLGAFVTKHQLVSLVGARGTVTASRAVAPGKPITISFPLAPADVKDGVASVHLRMTVSYVPKDAGLGPDVRRLALILKRASAR
ncbi:MAG TPA: hypothetical protein VGC72_17320 [Candidatus Elarobacter sp.]